VPQCRGTQVVMMMGCGWLGSGWEVDNERVGEIQPKKKNRAARARF
jgi:hypothetical protein